MGVTPREQHLLDEVTQLKEDLARATAERDALANELERERMRLAACGVVATSNTPETAANNRMMHADYLSASLSDVIRVVDSEMAQRARAEKAEKANAALRAVVADERAYELQLCQYCARCGQSQLSRCEAEPTCNEREQKWWNAIIAALADPNLGADWVSGDAFHACDVERGALQVKLAETQERHQAELRRVAKAVRSKCVDAATIGLVKGRIRSWVEKSVLDVDLDEIVRGGK